jgi:hypothetical protein
MRKKHWWWVAAVAVVALIAGVVGQQPAGVRWEHSGENVTAWKVCSQRTDCQPVTPTVVERRAPGVLVYQVKLPRRQAKPPVVVQACNAHGCAETEAR